MSAQVKWVSGDADVRETVSDGPRIVVFSDRGIFRSGVIELLKRHGFPHTVGCTSAEDLRRVFRETAVDLALIDLEHKSEDPREVFARLHHDWPRATTVAIGTSLRLAALARGADGWIDERAQASTRRLSAVALAVGRASKKRVHFPMPPEVERQIHTWACLTRRETQVLGLLACGIDNGEIGMALGISDRAVKAHVSRLFAKFKVDRRTKLALIASQAGVSRHPEAIPSLQAV